VGYFAARNIPLVIDHIPSLAIWCGTRRTHALTLLSLRDWMR